MTNYSPSVGRLTSDESDALTIATEQVLNAALVVVQLQTAAQLIRVDGWATGNMTDAEGRRCTVGAIITATPAGSEVRGFDACEALVRYLDQHAVRYFWENHYESLACVGDCIIEDDCDCDCDCDCESASFSSQLTYWNDMSIPRAQGATLVPEALDGAALWIASMNGAELHGMFS